MWRQKKASLRLPERKNALGGGRKVSASVCRLKFRVICRAPMWARNGRSAAARPVTIRCGCWAVIRRALGGRADWRALPKWCPSSPAAMCRHRTGDVMARDVRCEKTFSLRVPWAGNLDRPLAVRRETAARPDGFRSAQIRLNPEAPLQGELAPKAPEGSARRAACAWVVYRPTRRAARGSLRAASRPTSPFRGGICTKGA